MIAAVYGLQVGLSSVDMFIVLIARFLGSHLLAQARIHAHRLDGRLPHLVSTLTVNVRTQDV